MKDGFHNQKIMKRRTFLEFLGTGIFTAAFLPGTSFGRLAMGNYRPRPFYLKGIEPTAEDNVVLAPGLEYELLVKWGDPISATERFGFNNDFLAFLPLDGNPDDGLLWVNHEYVDPMFVSGYKGIKEKTKVQVDREMYSVGGSIVRLQKQDGRWKMVADETYNRRLTANTVIPFNWHEPILDKTSAVGTLANCAGGVTPWGTILTCEENYDMFYGERDFKTGERKPGLGDTGWHRFFDYPPEHYGWVVEVNPLTGEAQKHVALGRCAHECATVVQLPDGRIVIYSGDDANDQCVYKFISSEPGSLTKGTLYVANVAFGRWVSLKYEEQKVLQAKFASQTEVLIRLREAARYVGGSPLDRPEDIEIDPLNGNVLVSLTNNTPRGNYTGSILKIMETDGKHDSLTFTSETYLTGSEATGFACPDNLAFDAAGNLWFTSDISGSVINKHPAYLPFKNNGLFVVPREGEQAGKVIQVASAPVEAEFTGPWFSPDGKTLFLSVQHPGEYSENLSKASSHWPGGGKSLPRPGVIAIYGVGE
jgi:hypothetical protein